MSGAAAVLLQANRGPTPPLIKDILPCSAQSIAGATLLQQSAGLLNVDGAVRLAKVLRSDRRQDRRRGRHHRFRRQSAGHRPAHVRILSAENPFKQWQAFYDPRLLWVKKNVGQQTVRYWPNGNTTWPMAVLSGPAPNMTLVTPGVVSLGELVGSSSRTGKTGAFTPTASLASGETSGSGVVISQSVMIFEGVVISEGLVISEGMLTSESGRPSPLIPNNAGLLGEP